MKLNKIEKIRLEIKEFEDSGFTVMQKELLVRLAGMLELQDADDLIKFLEKIAVVEMEVCKSSEVSEYKLKLPEALEGEFTDGEKEELGLVVEKIPDIKPCYKTYVGKKERAFLENEVKIAEFDIDIFQAAGLTSFEALAAVNFSAGDVSAEAESLEVARAEAINAEADRLGIDNKEALRGVFACNADQLKTVKFQANLRSLADMSGFIFEHIYGLGINSVLKFVEREPKKLAEDLVKAINPGGDLTSGNEVTEAIALVKKLALSEPEYTSIIREIEANEEKLQEDASAFLQGVFFRILEPKVMDWMVTSREYVISFYRDKWDKADQRCTWEKSNLSEMAYLDHLIDKYKYGIDEVKSLLDDHRLVSSTAFRDVYKSHHWHRVSEVRQAIAAVQTDLRGVTKVGVKRKPAFYGTHSQTYSQWLSWRLRQEYSENYVPDFMMGIRNGIKYQYDQNIGESIEKWYEKIGETVEGMVPSFKTVNIFSTEGDFSNGKTAEKISGMVIKFRETLKPQEGYLRLCAAFLAIFSQSQDIYSLAKETLSVLEGDALKVVRNFGDHGNFAKAFGLILSDSEGFFSFYGSYKASMFSRRELVRQGENKNVDYGEDSVEHPSFKRMMRAVRGAIDEDGHKSDYIAREKSKFQQSKDKENTKFTDQLMVDYGYLDFYGEEVKKPENSSLPYNSHKRMPYGSLFRRITWAFQCLNHALDGYSKVGKEKYWDYYTNDYYRLIFETNYYSHYFFYFLLPILLAKVKSQQASYQEAEHLMMLVVDLTDIDEENYGELPMMGLEYWRDNDLPLDNHFMLTPFDLLADEIAFAKMTLAEIWLAHADKLYRDDTYESIQHAGQLYKRILRLFPPKENDDLSVRAKINSELDLILQNQDVEPEVKHFLVEHVYQADTSLMEKVLSGLTTLNALPKDISLPVVQKAVADWSKRDADTPPKESVGSLVELREKKVALLRESVALEMGLALSPVIVADFTFPTNAPPSFEEVNVPVGFSSTFPVPTPEEEREKEKAETEEIDWLSREKFETLKFCGYPNPRILRMLEEVTMRLSYIGDHRNYLGYQEGDRSIYTFNRLHQEAVKYLHLAKEFGRLMLRFQEAYEAKGEEVFEAKKAAALANERAGVHRLGVEQSQLALGMGLTGQAKAATAYAQIDKEYQYYSDAGNVVLIAFGDGAKASAGQLGGLGKNTWKEIQVAGPRQAVGAWNAEARSWNSAIGWNAVSEASAPQSGANWGGWGLQTAAKFAGSFLQSLFNSWSREKVLAHQRKMAGFDETLAAQRVAFLQKSVEVSQAVQRMASLNAVLNQEYLHALGAQELNLTAYLYLAGQVKQWYAEYLDLAIRYAWLMQQQLVFERGVPVDAIGFHYHSQDKGGTTFKALLHAAETLESDVEELRNQKVLTEQQRVVLQKTLSFRRDYPVQFLEFLRTGVMRFATSVDYIMVANFALAGLSSEEMIELKLLTYQFFVDADALGPDLLKKIREAGRVVNERIEGYSGLEFSQEEVDRLLKFLDESDSGNLKSKVSRAVNHPKELKYAGHYEKPDHFGHLQQRIDYVDFQLIGVLPPYGDLNLKLANLGASVVMARHPRQPMPQPVALSHAYEQVVFDRTAQSTQQDYAVYSAKGQLKPFEGVGMDTLWEFNMSSQSPFRDASRIHDVRMVIHYSAQHDAAYESIQKEREADGRRYKWLPNEGSSTRTFSLQENYAQAHYNFQNPASKEVGFRDLRLVGINADFAIPAWQQDPRINAVHFYLPPKDGESLVDFSFPYTQVNSLDGDPAFFQEKQIHVRNEFKDPVDGETRRIVGLASSQIINGRDEGEPPFNDDLAAHPKRRFVFKFFPELFRTQSEAGYFKRDKQGAFVNTSGEPTVVKLPERALPAVPGESTPSFFNTGSYDVLRLNNTGAKRQNIQLINIPEASLAHWQQCRWEMKVRLLKGSAEIHWMLSNSGGPTRSLMLKLSLASNEGFKFAQYDGNEGDNLLPVMPSLHAGEWYQLSCVAIPMLSNQRKTYVEIYLDGVLLKKDNVDFDLETSFPFAHFSGDELKALKALGKTKWEAQPGYAESVYERIQAFDERGILYKEEPFLAEEVRFLKALLTSNNAADFAKKLVLNRSGDPGAMRIECSPGADISFDDLLIHEVDKNGKPVKKLFVDTFTRKERWDNSRPDAPDERPLVWSSSDLGVIDLANDANPEMDLSAIDDILHSVSYGYQNPPGV